MKMKRFFLFLMTPIVALTLFGDADAELEFRSNSKVSPGDTISATINSEPSIPVYQEATKNSINATKKGIQLHFRDYPLGEVLKNINDETGIRFNLSSKMEKIPINVDIEAKYWKSSVRQLIKDFSRVEVWTNNHRTSQIWLVESNSYH
ncbi:MAG: hypothetical protein HN646_04805 [Nitrospina sp.]|nr:hypothetical protein [Nitrospina sp.]